MALRVVGAGVGRTGTNSLKLALERLLGGRCYHMYELAKRPADTPAWEAAISGQALDWDALLGDFSAAVDWPASAFWREISDANPRAIVLLSTRNSAQEWWESFERTILARITAPTPDDDEDLRRRRAMTQALLRERFTPRWQEREGAIEAYERHNAHVRAGAPRERLLEWRAGEGWEPLCEALGLAVPDEPFPHVNTSAQFQAPAGAAAEPPERESRESGA